MLTSHLRTFVLAAGCAAYALPVAAQDFQFRVNMPGNEQSIAYQSVDRFNTVLGELTDGAVRLNLFANSALGDQDASLEAMQTGLLDMATIEPPMMTGSRGSTHGAATVRMPATRLTTMRPSTSAPTVLPR